MNRPLAALLALLTIGIGITVAVAVTDDNDGHRSATVTIKVDGKDRDRRADDKLTVPRTAVDQAAKNLKDKKLHDGQPSERVLAAERKIRRTQKGLPTAGATQGFPGCVTRFVANQSSRHGVRPQEFVLHYTVSRNVPGWADVNAIVSLFDRPSFSASSNFVLDAEGHCAYIVPIEAKSWTQAALNPFAVSVEVIDMGDESSYLAQGGYRKLGQIMRTVQARTGIPVGRVGAVSGCVPTRSGTIEHAQGGACAGGHSDIGKFVVSSQIAQALGGVVKPSILSSLEAKIVHGDAHPKGTGHSRRYWCQQNDKQRARLSQLGHFNLHHRGARRHRLGKSFEKWCR